MVPTSTALETRRLQRRGLTARYIAVTAGDRAVTRIATVPLPSCLAIRGDQNEGSGPESHGSRTLSDAGGTDYRPANVVPIRRTERTHATILFPT